MAGIGDEPVPRRVAAIILAITALLGAVEATPKEIVVSLSVDPASASPLSTLPTGTSELARILREAGYDVRIYGDATDLAADAPRRFALIVVSPEAIPEPQARLVARVMRAAERAVLVVFDERPLSDGAAYLMGLVAQAACGDVGLPLAPTVEEAGYLIYGAGAYVDITPVPSFGPMKVPGVKAPYPPLPPVMIASGVEVIAFATTDWETWVPAGYYCHASPRVSLLYVGSGFVVRNVALQGADANASIVRLVTDVIGPPGSIVVAFIVGFYVKGGLTLATVIHPSYILSLAAQAYVALEPTLLERLHGATWAAAVAGAVLLVASTVARTAFRPPPRVAPPAPPLNAREWLDALCSLSPSDPACRGGVAGALRRLYYRLLGPRRVYLERLSEDARRVAP